VSDAMIETETAGVELGAGEAVPVRDTALPAIYAEITRRLNPHRRHRSCPPRRQARPAQQLPDQEVR
jgi:hypothetical protein